MPAQIRIETVLRHKLAAVLLEHPTGIDPQLGYRLVEQTSRMPQDWFQPIPFGDAYNKLKATGTNWKTLSADELSARVRTEPKWRNRLRQVVRHFRDEHWMEDDAHGTWRLSSTGLAQAKALNAAELSFAERGVLAVHSKSPPVRAATGAEAATTAERERVLREIFARRGQATFRDALLRAYGGKCAFSGCDAVEALEAAHVMGVAAGGSDQPANGLLLRSDLHTLFDLNLIGVDPTRRVLALAPTLLGTDYREFQGRSIREPEPATLRPAEATLHLRWSMFLAACGTGR